MSNTEYNKGYQAGLRTSKLTKDEQLMLESLKIAIEHCSNWNISGKPINTIEGYAKLARIIADNIISVGKKPA